MPTLMQRIYNRGASSARNKPAEIIKSLRIRQGDRIADIGSGGGYFTFEFARRVGASGKVYAVDTNAKFLEHIRRDAQSDGIRNVETVPVGDGEPALPERALDLVFLRDVFHHLPEQQGYFARLRRALKPGARVAIIDYRAPGSYLNLIRLFGHYTDEARIVDTMNQAGYDLAETLRFLPGQSFNIFKIR